MADKKKKKAKKPVRYTVARIAEALHATKGAPYLAAEMLGCSHTLVYNRIREHPTLRDIKDFYDGQLTDVAYLKLREQVLAGSQWAVKYVMSHKGQAYGFNRDAEDGESMVTVKIIQGPDPDRR